MLTLRHFFRCMLLGALLCSGAVAQAVTPGKRLPIADDVMPRPITISVPGAGLKPVVLQSVAVHTEIVGRLAQTTVDLTFQNPNNRVLEGQLQFPLLDGQSVTGFALEMPDGSLRTAVSVEKDKGRQVFEDVTRQRIDPALLEVTQGNNYQARVYPLNPNGTRRVQVRYTEVLRDADDGLRYRLPLTYPNRLKAFDVQVRVDGAARAPTSASTALGALKFVKAGTGFEARLSQQDFAAKGTVDVVIPLAPVMPTYTQTVDGQTYFYAEVSPNLFAGMAATQRRLPKRIGLLWDASGSGQSRNHTRELALLDAWFAKVQNVTVSLQRVRDRAEPAKTFSVVGGDWQALRRELESTVYDGASNLAEFDTRADVDEFLLFSDGIDNYGDKRFEAPAKPMFAVLAATVADPVRLRYLSERSGGQLIDLTADKPEAALQGLLLASPRLIGMQSNGARDLVSTTNIPGKGFAIAGVLTESTTSVQLTFLQPDGQRKTVDVPAKTAPESSDQIAAEWARLRVAQLEGDYDFNKGEIRRLGKAFGLVTRETSLIVLDRVEDYVRYDVAPPPELRQAFEKLRVDADNRTRNDKAQHLQNVAAQWAEREKWWQRDFPKSTPPQPKVTEDRGDADLARAPAAAMPAPSALEPVQSSASRSFDGNQRMAVTKADAGAGAAPVRQASIRLRAWTPDEPYIERMAQAQDEDIYRHYLDERASYADSTAFFLDVADLLLSRGQTDLGLRVLSNLAEMNLENRQVLRVLGYRLLQAGQARLAVPVFRKVRDLAQEEPQSFRDLGLAYAQDGQPQQAIDMLWQVAERPWQGRFPGIEVIALTEMNTVIATAPQKLDTSRIDPRFLHNMPLDLRVILTWDTDLTDIDLWVTDPNGERAFYGNRLSYQGGAVSPDCTQGYGPEEYSLKKAKPGNYKVEVKFYGERQQIVTGGTTIQMKLFTHYATAEQKEQSVTMRLKKPGEGIFVGEFEVK